MSSIEKNEEIIESTFTERLDFLEKRILALENEIYGSKKVSEKPITGGPDTAEDENYSVRMPWEDSMDVNIETNFGEYGLAWLGNIVLFLGIAFFMHYVSSIGQPIIAGLTGLGACAAMIFLSRSMEKSFRYLSFMLNIFGIMMLFYTISRLYFFTVPPVIPSKLIIIVLLFLVCGYTFFESIRKKSQGIAALGYLFVITLAVLSDITHIFLPLVALSATLSVYLFNRFGWSQLLMLSVILSYPVFLLWLLNNPLMGHPVQAVGYHQYCFIYLGITGAVYSMVTLVKRKEVFPDGIILATVLLNGFGFSAILGLLVSLFFPSDYILKFISIAFFCLIFSAILKYRSPWKYSPALYALYGFMAISIAIYGIYSFPKAYLFLAFQSLMVVSIALWYRSRIIVVMNLLLFIMILTGYLRQPVVLQVTNFAFPLVAFFSARIINWQKERLEIKTELIRNIYLILVFFTMLYAVYKAVPSQYVTLSWTLISVLYLIISIVLKLVKYRYMTFANLLASAIYLFAVDLARIGMIYKIIAFLSLAIIMIGISIWYVNKIKKNGMKNLN